MRGIRVAEIRELLAHLVLDSHSCINALADLMRMTSMLRELIRPTSKNDSSVPFRATMVPSVRCRSRSCTAQYRS
jgi:hypothetical protein